MKLRFTDSLRFFFSQCRKFQACGQLENLNILVSLVVAALQPVQIQLDYDRLNIFNNF